MPHTVLFRYRITFEDFANPPGTCDRVREELRTWVAERRLGFCMGALGGSRCLDGHVGYDPPAGETDRQALAAWLWEQRMQATIQLGPIQQGEYSLFDPITDLVF